MIKLLKILSEIKIVPKITPEIIDNLETEIWNNLSNDEIDNIVKMYSQIGWIPGTGGWLKWLYTLDQSKLNQIYRELLKYK